MTFTRLLLSTTWHFTPSLRYFNALAVEGWRKGKQNGKIRISAEIMKDPTVYKIQNTMLYEVQCVDEVKALYILTFRITILPARKKKDSF